MFDDNEEKVIMAIYKGYYDVYPTGYLHPDNPLIKLSLLPSAVEQMDADSFFREDITKNRQLQAAAELILHNSMMMMTTATIPVGITSESIGGASISYGGPQNMGDVNETVHLRKYKALMPVVSAAFSV